jgi:hypothetical protein
VLGDRGFDHFPMVEFRDVTLHFVGLEKTKDLMPSQLSGGMKKRIGKAKWLCSDGESDEANGEAHRLLPVFRLQNRRDRRWNAGDQSARILEIISPAGFEKFFGELASWERPSNPTELTVTASR